jgi:programmed cell death protein 5
MVKESRAKLVEDRLIMIARSGQLQQKVSDTQLKQMLNSLSEHEKQSGPTLDNIQVVRKSRWDEDDLDDLLKES